MKKNRKRFVIVSAIFMAFAFPVYGDLSTQPAPRINEFQKPFLEQQYRQIAKLIDQGQNLEAEKIIRDLLSQAPFLAMPNLMLSHIYAGRSNQVLALRYLKAATESGEIDPVKIRKKPIYKEVSKDPEFQRIMRRADQIYQRKQANPLPFIAMPATNGKVLVSPVNTRWNPQVQFLTVGVQFNPKQEKGRPLAKVNKPYVEKLNSLFDSAMAAGNIGDLYDNRDRGHSQIIAAHFPQVTFTQYGPEAKQTNADYGLNKDLLFNTITIGNSSTAITSGHLARSQSRFPTTQQDLMNKQYLHYVHNHLYLYPAVRDFMVQSGDRFLANTPYVVTTKGRSGSDKPFMRALFATLAAFKPEVKETLRQQRLIAPTLQYILRRTQKPLQSGEDYLSAKAHPIAFDAQNLDIMAMIDLAQNMTVETLPPSLGLQVEKESQPVAGLDDFLAGYSEKLFDTPSALARVIRSTAYEKTMTLSVQSNIDLNRQDAKVHWVVLNGDQDRITIRPLNEQKSRVEIKVPWHERRAHPVAPEIQTDRVEIAAFIQKGEVYSAPAFVNFIYPASQKRTYEQGRLVRIDHNDASYRKRYVDPLVFPSRNWTDLYQYDANGVLTGWERVRTFKETVKTTSFTQDGLLIRKKDAQGRAVRAEWIGYEQRKNKNPQNKKIHIVERPLREFKDFKK